MQKYFSFDGVTGRSEFWGITVVASIGVACLAMIGLMLMLGGLPSDEGFSEGNIIMVMFGGIVLLTTIAGCMWLSIATAMRRCRDAGINVMWSLAQFVPYVGTAAYIVIGCIPTATTAPTTIDS